jgi:negative regulator of sigma-B (phosphoserine phosphatase)
MQTQIGTAQRPRTGEVACGDVGAVIPFSGGVLLCLADGLGHGEEARASAEQACSYARAHAEAPLETLLRGIDGALAGMRGAAVSILALHPAEARMQFAGIGNVELRAVARARVAPPTMAGIVGQRIRGVRVWEYELAAGDLLVLATDGISSRFDLSDLAHLAPQALADTLVAQHHKSHDDASCLVVRVGAA